MRLLFVALIAAAGVVVAAQPQQFPPSSRVPPGGARPDPPAGQRSSPPPRVRSATGDALDRYLQGEYERATSTLSMLGGFNLEQARTWINARGPAEEGRRRLAAATFILEYTGGRENLSPTLIEWARDLVKQAPSLPDETLWLRASIALCEGREAWSFLNGVWSTSAPAATVTPPTDANAPGAAPQDAAPPEVARGYLADARARFPDDPHFILAEVVGAEVASTLPADVGAMVLAGHDPKSDRLAADMFETTADRSSPRARALERVAALLAPLTTHTEVGAEAHVRLGYVQLRRGDEAEALDHFRQAIAAATDTDMKYLGHFYAAWTLARGGHVDDATMEYRAALSVVPHARSATTLLTALLMMHERLDAAETVANEFLVAPIAPHDPWRTYLLGDYRDYPQILARLRARVKS